MTYDPMTYDPMTWQVATKSRILQSHLFCFYRLGNRIDSVPDSEYDPKLKAAQEAIDEVAGPDSPVPGEKRKMIAVLYFLASFFILFSLF